MVDFKLLAKRLQDKKGYCLLPYRYYDTVSCKRICRITGKVTNQQLHYVIHSGMQGDIFRVLNGSTGHESYYIHSFLDNPISGWWPLCGGSYKYDKLLVNGAEVLSILKEFGYE